MSPITRVFLHYQFRESEGQRSEVKYLLYILVVFLPVIVIRNKICPLIPLIKRKLVWLHGVVSVYLISGKPNTFPSLLYVEMGTPTLRNTLLDLSFTL